MSQYEGEGRGGRRGQSELWGRLQHPLTPDLDQAEFGDWLAVGAGRRMNRQGGGYGKIQFRLAVLLLFYSLIYTPIGINIGDVLGVDVGAIWDIVIGHSSNIYKQAVQGSMLQAAWAVALLPWRLGWLFVTCLKSAVVEAISLGVGIATSATLIAAALTWGVRLVVLLCWLAICALTLTPSPPPTASRKQGLASVGLGLGAVVVAGLVIGNTLALQIVPLYIVEGVACLMLVGQPRGTLALAAVVVLCHYRQLSLFKSTCLLMLAGNSAPRDQAGLSSTRLTLLFALHTIVLLYTGHYGLMGVWGLCLGLLKGVELIDARCAGLKYLAYRTGRGEVAVEAEAGGMADMRACWDISIPIQEYH